MVEISDSPDSKIYLLLFYVQTIDALPDKIIMNIFSYLSHREISRNAVVCKRWRLLAYDSRLWNFVSLRPEVSGLHVSNIDHLVHLIG